MDRLASHVDVLRHAYLRMPKLVGPDSGGDSLSIQQCGQRLPEGVRRHPIQLEGSPDRTPLLMYR